MISVSRLRCLAIPLLACAAFSAAALPLWGAAEEADRTSTIKAAFVYRFIQYVRWKEPEGETRPTGPFVIHILGESSLETPLRKIAEKKKVGERELVIRKSDSADALEPCQIVLLAPSTDDRLDHILEQLGDRKLLTVGDADGFGKRGVAINFVLNRGKVRFEINRKALADADLWVSSQLLKLGILVE